MTELKPCPFCGKTDTVHCFTKTFCTVTCVPSEGGCGGSTGLFCTGDEAIAAWNSRDPGVAIRTIVNAVMDGVLERRNGSS